MHIRRLIIWSIIATGISSVTVQLVTIREFLSQFHGNEITISMVLFCWLLLTGLGSLAAKLMGRSSLTLYALFCLFIALWPLAQLLFIRIFRETIFIHGTSPGFYQIFLFITATITPYCLIVGFILPYALQVITHNGYPFTSGRLYITDSIGDIAGGVLFSFILVYWLKPFQCVAVSSCLLIITAMWLLMVGRRWLLTILGLILSTAFFSLALNGRYEVSTLTEQYGRIVRYVESPYGRIVVTREGSQHTFWESGAPLYSDADIVNSEEKVHYALSQLDRVGNVLLISGGLGETLNEIAKHKPAHVDYVELDPNLTREAKKIGLLRNRPGLTIINTDGRRYLAETTKKYDAVIVDLPDPDTFQLNRFFTSEFFSLAKGILTPQGILSFGLTYYPHYISEVRKKKLSTLFTTVGLHFQNVLVIPGEEALFLCRDRPITTKIPERLGEKGVETRYIQGFFHGNITETRLSQMNQSVRHDEYINTDFAPRVINIVFKEWFKKHGDSPNVFLVVLLGLSVVYLMLMRKEEYVLFSTGMVTMGVEMLIIFCFQVVYGYIYLKIGAIITAFLGGLLPGAIIGNTYRGRPRTNLIFSETALFVLLLLFFIWLDFHRHSPHPFYFLIYGFVFAFFCGFQFPAATSLIGEKKSPAAGCIAADLAGAAAGTLITGTLLIPLWGIRSAIMFLLLMKISSSMIIMFRKAR